MKLRVIVSKLLMVGSKAYQALWSMLGVVFWVVLPPCLMWELVQQLQVNFAVLE